MITEFSLWQPEGQVTPKAIVVLTPPSQCDGRYMVKDPTWQEFATKHNLALVGCFFQDAEMGAWIETYCNMAFGAGDKLIKFLDAKIEGFANNEGRPKLLLWGFSAGGQFNYEFASKYPELVDAFVANKGGVYFTHLASDAARRLPGLFIIGADDSDWRKDSVKGIFALNWVAGARGWHLIEEPETGHRPGNSVEYGMKLFEAVLQKD